ncbi:MAG: sporulation protein YunB [Clostridia bacterium]|nr:sporulation protein YunB [Clostridia bacterium]
MQVAYYKNKKRKAKKRKWFVALFCIATIFTAICVYYFKVVCPIVIQLSQEKIRSVSTRIISQSVNDVIITQNITYDGIVNISYSNDNKIELIEVDTIKVNMLVRQITQEVQRHFDGISNEGVDIALGTFSGIPFLYGVGPKISVQLVPVGTINTKFASSFQSAGINQTIHRLYFQISASVGMVLPANTQNFVTEMEVALCESIIVGDIPSVYLQGSLI